MDSIHKIVAVIFLYINFSRLILVQGDHGYVDLPESHLPYYLNSFPKVIEQCLSNSSCIYRTLLLSDGYESKKCCGYEPHCLLENAFSQPECSKSKPTRIKTFEEYVKTFYYQADFGQIGGYCKVNWPLFDAQMDHMSPLQSWAPELRNFAELNERPIDEQKCDLVYEKPVYIMKIDATNNMYHHFCDFFNLYASLHVNMSHASSFDTDNYIFLWETYNYVTPFSVAFKAFSRNPIFTIKAWTDIFIGMHGAGLTHLLFLPKWATVFEIYNCEDSECYKDLARLRGVNYLTWENKDKLVQQDEGQHPSGGAHAKFTNYSFDKHEFTRLVDKAADYVLNHEEFKKFVLYNFDSVHDEL